MTDQPARVTPGEISGLLAYHEHKASLLSRIAADTHSAEAHQIAADAWRHVRVLAARLRQQSTAGVTP